MVMVLFGFLAVSGVDAFLTHGNKPFFGKCMTKEDSKLSSYPTACLKGSSSDNGDGNNGESGGIMMPDGQILSSAEEMEEFLNNLAAKLSAELPDDPIEDKLTRFQSWAGEYDQDAFKKRIQKQIDEHNVLIFGLSDCPYCKEAKDLLSENDVKFMAREFDTLPNDQWALRSELAKILDGRTEVPAIFIKGKFVGGLNDGGSGGLKAILDEEGKLEEMLKE